MFHLASTLMILCLVAELQGADAPRFGPDPYLLHTTFDEKDPRWNFNHDVKIRSKGNQLTVTVLYDLNRKDQPADKTDAQQVRGGLGNPRGDGAAESSEGPTENPPLFRIKQKLQGNIDTTSELRFGITTIYDGKLVSLHYIGRPILGGATGKVYFFSSGEAVREGKWYLRNSFSRGNAVPGFNGASPFGR